MNSKRENGRGRFHAFYPGFVFVFCCCGLCAFGKHSRVVDQEEEKMDREGKRDFGMEKECYCLGNGKKVRRVVGQT